MRDGNIFAYLEKHDIINAGILIDIHTWEYYVIHGKTECEVQIKDNPDAYKAFICANKNKMMFIHNHP